LERLCVLRSLLGSMLGGVWGADLRGAAGRSDPSFLNNTKVALETVNRQRHNGTIFQKPLVTVMVLSGHVSLQIA
jgi:hypothetical protein